MDAEKVIQDLNRRFAAPLPEFYQRRIIFWYDEDKEFEDKLDQVVLENAKVIALTGNNAFSVKKLLSVDDLTTNYLIYSPLAYTRPDDNWLLDVELYSEEFRADLISLTSPLQWTSFISPEFGGRKSLQDLGSLLFQNRHLMC